jgi:hypothetical protein
VIILAFVGWVAYVWFNLEKPSNIQHFHPSAFQAKADARFFYSIGGELKNSDSLDPNAPTLLRGQFSSFLVSPDETQIAVVGDGLLTVVGRDGTLVRQVAHVDPVVRVPKPVGQHFYHDDDFQWARDSKALYLIGDEYTESKPVFTCTGSNCGNKDKEELWRYDLQTGSLQQILSPFPAYSYFLGRGSGIYFSAGTKDGGFELKYFDGKKITDVGMPDAREIPTGGRSGSAVESPFFSFNEVDYESVVLPAKGVDLVRDEPNRLQRLVISDKPYLTLTRGKNWKSNYYCSELYRSVFLPGDRYFVFNTSRCGNFSGLLLIDTHTGQYERLPDDTRVYLNLNTESDSHYRITGGGIRAK